MVTVLLHVAQILPYFSCAGLYRGQLHHSSCSCTCNTFPCWPQC